MLVPVPGLNWFDAVAWKKSEKEEANATNTSYLYHRNHLKSNYFIMVQQQIDDVSGDGWEKRWLAKKLWGVHGPVLQFFV